MSVRAFLIVVAVCGAWLGWIIRGARIRREAVAAIERGRGEVSYYRYYRGTTKDSYVNKALRWAGAWSPEYQDYFFDVRWVNVGSDSPDQVMDHVARLKRVKWLYFVDDGWSNSVPTAISLAKVRPLTSLEQLSFAVTPRLGDADLANLKALTNLMMLRLAASHGSDVTDAGIANLHEMSAMAFLDLEKHSRLTAAGLVHLRGNVGFGPALGLGNANRRSITDRTP